MSFEFLYYVLLLVAKFLLFWCLLMADLSSTRIFWISNIFVHLRTMFKYIIKLAAIIRIRQFVLEIFVIEYFWCFTDTLKLSVHILRVQ